MKKLELWSRSLKKMTETFPNSMSDEKILDWKAAWFLSCYRDYKGRGIRMYRGRHPWCCNGDVVFARITDIEKHNKYLKNFRKSRQS